METSSWKKLFEVFCFVVVFVVPVILYLMEKAGASLSGIFIVGWLSIAAAALYLVLSIPWVWADASIPLRIWRIFLVCSVALLSVGYGAIRIWPNAKSQPEQSKNEQPASASGKAMPQHHDTENSASAKLEHRRAAKPPIKQEPLTLKNLFSTDFRRPDVSVSEYPTSITFKQNPQEPLTLEFVAREWQDSNANSKFVTIYIPSQDRDPEKATSKSFLLCSLIEMKFADLMAQLDGLQLIESPVGTGNLRKSTEFKFTGRIIIYHEDFMRPQDIGDLVRNYSERGLLLEFRGEEYLGAQELLRAAHRQN
jgi:hypothetical protein